MGKKSMAIVLALGLGLISWALYQAHKVYPGDPPLEVAMLGSYGVLLLEIAFAVFMKRYSRRVMEAHLRLDGCTEDQIKKWTNWAAHASLLEMDIKR